MAAFHLIIYGRFWVITEGIATLPNHGLKGGRSNVEIPIGQDKIERNLAETVCLSDPLLVRTTVVSTAHVVRLNYPHVCRLMCSVNERLSVCSLAEVIYAWQG